MRPVERFTALHRALGRPRGPISDEMIDELVATQVAERADVDFKRDLPPTSGIAGTDFPKDVAAMANSGGGTIVYGITETDKRATGRVDTELSENHERTARQAAIASITPPVLNLQIDRVVGPGGHCVAITVPTSPEGPHLIYRNGYFGAPLRVDADTIWMTERQIEAMYRARFDRRRDRSEELNALYAQTLRGRDTAVRAWFVAVAVPRSPAVRLDRMTRDEARACLKDADGPALALAASNQGIHPLNEMDRLNPRAGLRSWVARSFRSAGATWKEATGSVGESGTVTLAAAIGGHRSPDGFWPGRQAEVSAIECAVADFFGLLRSTARHLRTTDYDIQVGVEWTGPDGLQFLVADPMGWYIDSPEWAPPVHFVPVSATVPVDADDEEFTRHAYEVALDCVNQGGAARTSIIVP